MNHTQENCFSLHDFTDKTTNVSKYERLEPKFYDEEIPGI